MWFNDVNFVSARLSKIKFGGISVHDCDMTGIAVNDINLSGPSIKNSNSNSIDISDSRLSRLITDGVSVDAYHEFNVPKKAYEPS